MQLFDDIFVYRDVFKKFVVLSLLFVDLILGENWYEFLRGVLIVWLMICGRGIYLIGI